MAFLPSVRVAAVFGLLVLASAARAQVPAPRLDVVFPAGGRVGSTFEMELGGADLDGLTALHFSHAGLRAKPSGPNKFQVSIAADTPLGIHDVRAVGRFGISNPRAFAVSDGLVEVGQQRPNHEPDQAQRVAFGCVVNGRFSGSADDFYLLSLKAGQRALVECQAAQLDAELDPALSVLDPEGREVAFNNDHFGRDPLVDFTAKTDGDYLVRLRDFYFRGGAAYRLRVGRFPVLDAVVPGCVAPGETREFTLIGRNLPGEKLVARLSAPTETQWLAPLHTPAVDFRLFQYAVRTEHGPSNPVGIRLEGGPQLLETKPNNSPETAMELPAGGAAVSGALEKYRDQGWFRVRWKAKQSYYVSVAAERLGAPGDHYVQVFDPQGKFVVELDHHAVNLGGAFRAAHRDPYGAVQPAADGEYRLVVRDRARQGGPRHRFVLTVSPPRPDFAVFVCSHLAESLQGQPPLWAGASMAFDLVLLRRDGLAGEVLCEAAGLPPGVRCPPVRIPAGQDRAVLVFSADTGAADWAGPVAVRCRALVGGKPVERPAWASVLTNNITEPQKVLPSRVAREVCMAVRGRAPFGLEAAPAESTVVRGQKLKLKVTLHRHATDFKGKVTLGGLGLPPGFTLPKAEIPGGASEAAVDLDVGAAAGTYTFALRGEAVAPFRRDPKQPAKEVSVALPTNLVTVTVKDK
jgi:hypothetical protein